jgi:hypothetical protein
MNPMNEHHAQLLYGDSIAESALPAEYAASSADVMHFVTERFTIDDARQLKTYAEGAPFSAPHRVFVLVVRSIAPEAQQALLKLFEEPPRSARFFVIVPRTAQILPTLRSRLFSAEDGAAPAGPTEAFDAFHAAGYAERLEMIADRVKEKDTSFIEEIVRGCESYASAVHAPGLLHAVMLCREYLPYRGASAKMLLESLALELPQSEV